MLFHGSNLLETMGRVMYLLGIEDAAEAKVEVVAIGALVSGATDTLCGIIYRLVLQDWRLSLKQLRLR